MNRKIKFRVWDKTTNEFLDNEYFKITGNGNVENYLTENENDKNCVIQQFTGLLDKNEKEIYEGDILKLYYTDPLIGFVKFCYGESAQRDGEWRVGYAQWVLVKLKAEEFAKSTTLLDKSDFFALEREVEKRKLLERFKQPNYFEELRNS